jgi:adenylyltransferase/sulfurtransferase
LRSALVVGAGGLGCPVLMALAPTVRLTVVDPDRVDESNLHRQILYRSEDAGRFKVECAAERLGRRFPAAPPATVVGRLDAANAVGLITGHDVVIDGTDSFATKFLLNDTCLHLGVPLVHGAAVGWTGQLMTVIEGGACYRCIFEGPPDEQALATCRDAGIMGALCGVIGGWMAQEAMAVIQGQPRLAGKLRVFDAISGRTRDLSPKRRSSCPAHPDTEVATW